MKDTSWPEAMAQQTKSEVAAESLKLQGQGMDKELAYATARKRVALGLQIRSRILECVAKTCLEDDYVLLAEPRKVEVLVAGVKEAAAEIRADMIKPIEAIIDSSCKMVLNEIIQRVAEADDGVNNDTTSGTEGGDAPEVPDGEQSTDVS
jgi:hypothetical protein